MKHRLTILALTFLICAQLVFALVPLSQTAVKIIFILGIGLSVLMVYEQTADFLHLAADKRRQIQTITEKAEREPEKAKYAWDLARVKLEAYFDSNLWHVQLIFYFAVGVMIVGFGFIIWGVYHALSKPDAGESSELAAVSGIITEFIGATFLIIYRSTMAQANQFMSVLERINTVGMAVQILDAIPDADTDLKNRTRAEITKLLLTVTSSRNEPPALSQDHPGR